MNKIKVVRLAQTMPVIDGEVADLSLEQYLNNIVGVTFKKSLNSGEKVEDGLYKQSDDLHLLENVLDQGHGSILEHVNLTYAVINSSRSFLAQQTRHRMMSYTSSSQHYIDHTNMSDAEVPVELIELNDPELIDIYMAGYNSAKESYNKLVNEKQVNHAVARQLLPNAQRNTLIITANVRSWLNYMNQRLCNRNTSEIKYIAYLIKEDMKKVIPMCTEYMVPDCIKYGHCTQKGMCCGKKWSEESIKEEFKILLEDKDEN